MSDVRSGENSVAPPLIPYFTSLTRFDDSVERSERLEDVAVGDLLADDREAREERRWRVLVVSGRDTRSLKLHEPFSRCAGDRL